MNSTPPETPETMGTNETSPAHPQVAHHNNSDHASTTQLPDDGLQTAQVTAPPPRNLLFKRLLLSLASLAFVWSLLEVMAIVITPDPSPFWLRDGIFNNSLPLVTGLSSFGVVPQQSEVRLPAEKRPGEIRIAVFGESSIEGVPFDHNASPPTMLYDELRRTFPDKDFTVINMGRTGSVATNTWYYLLKARDFQLDVIIFYFGANDAEDLGGEQCWAGQYPVTHTLWRSLVSASPLMRYLRMYLPQHLWAHQEAKPDFSCDSSAFSLWADLLIETASKAAPVVLVTTPVTSAYTALEETRAERPLSEVLSNPLYQQLLRCRLQTDCDSAPIYTARVAGLEGWLGTRDVANTGLLSWLLPIQYKSFIWRQAAQKHEVLFLDFFAIISRLSPGGWVGLHRQHFSDEVHLSLQGYLYLARLWVETLRPHLAQQPSRVASFPTPQEAAVYAAAVKGNPYSMLFNYIRRGWLLTVISGFEIVADHQVGGVRRPLAELVLGWARQQVGLPHNLPPDLAPLLAGFDPTTLDPEQTDDTWLWQRMNNRTETP